MTNSWSELAGCRKKTQSMTEGDYTQTLDKLDRLLNDPNVPMQPSLIWHLLGQVSKQDLPGGTMLSRILASDGSSGHSDIHE